MKPINTLFHKQIAGPFALLFVWQIQPFCSKDAHILGTTTWEPSLTSLSLSQCLQVSRQLTHSFVHAAHVGSFFCRSQPWMRQRPSTRSSDWEPMWPWSSRDAPWSTSPTWVSCYSLRYI